MYYKLTNQYMQTYHGFQWEIGKTVKTSGKGDLCGPGWLHCYDSHLLAVLLNPIHGCIGNPRLFEVHVAGKKKTDHGLKFGFTQMTLIKEIPLPEISMTQKVRFAILCAKEVTNDKKWTAWADNWLSGEDRSGAAARAAARAAAWAAAKINLKKIAKLALKGE